MNCKETRIAIEQLVFEPNAALEAKTKLHLDNCEACSLYYKESLVQSALIKTLRKNEPQLTQPEMLLAVIMEGINHEKTVEKQTRPVLIWLPRLLAAASICLLITFGIEQYGFVKKMSLLETQFAHIAVSENNSLPNSYPASNNLQLISLLTNEDGFFAKIFQKESAINNKQSAAITEEKIMQMNSIKSTLIQGFIVERSQTMLNTIQK